MFLFEKTVIGVYRNRLYGLKERLPFHDMATLKANSAGKNLNVTNINTKAGPPNRQTCLQPNNSFVYESKQPSFGQRHQF